MKLTIKLQTKEDGKGGFKLQQTYTEVSAVPPVKVNGLSERINRLPDMPEGYYDIVSPLQ